MKKVLFVSAVLALASSVMAAPTLVTLGYSSDARAITPDGKYVVGNAGTAGFFWDVNNNTSQTQIISGGKAASNATGVGYMTVGGNQQLVAYGLASGWPCAFISSDSGSTWGYSTATLTGSPSLPSANSLAGTTTDTFYANYKSGDYASYVGKYNSGTNAIAWDAKSTASPQKMAMNGISSAGVAVGRRRDSAGVNYQNYKLTYVGGGGAAAAFFNGLDGTVKGEAWSISNDGSKIFGYSPVLGGRTGNWPYMLDTATNAIVELPTLAGTAGSVTNGVVYGTSADGRWAVGMNYVGMEKAVLWDTVNGTVLDLTNFAAITGILGDMTGNLRRAYSVGVNADGYPVVAGYGVNSALSGRAWVMTVPEPTTLIFLALGALGILRRRA